MNLFGLDTGITKLKLVSWLLNLAENYLPCAWDRKSGIIPLKNGTSSFQ